MASVSKSKRRSTPGMTKNGRVKLRSLSLAKLEQMLEKSNKPKEKHKIRHFINNIVKKQKKKDKV